MKRGNRPHVKSLVIVIVIVLGIGVVKRVVSRTWSEARLLVTLGYRCVEHIEVE